MTWSYNPQPRNDLDRVRLLVGDTQAARPQLQDEEISTFLFLVGNTNYLQVTSTRTVLYRAAADSARAIAGVYGSQVTVVTADQRAYYETQMAHYLKLAAELQKRADSIGVGPLVGGLSISQKESSAENTDLPQPFFSRSFATEPGTGPDVALEGDQEALEFAP